MKQKRLLVDLSSDPIDGMYNPVLLVLFVHNLPLDTIRGYKKYADYMVQQSLGIMLSRLPILKMVTSEGPAPDSMPSLTTGTYLTMGWSGCVVLPGRAELSISQKKLGFMLT